MISKRSISFKSRWRESRWQGYLTSIWNFISQTQCYLKIEFDEIHWEKLQTKHRFNVILPLNGLLEQCIRTYDSAIRNIRSWNRVSLLSRHRTHSGSRWNTATSLDLFSTRSFSVFNEFLKREANTEESLLIYIISCLALNPNFFLQQRKPSFIETTVKLERKITLDRD